MKNVISLQLNADEYEIKKYFENSGNFLPIRCVVSYFIIVVRL